jgi:hypothetical protein
MEAGAAYTKGELVANETLSRSSMAACSHLPTHVIGPLRFGTTHWRTDRSDHGVTVDVIMISPRARRSASYACWDDSTGLSSRRYWDIFGYLLLGCHLWTVHRQ